MWEFHTSNNGVISELRQKVPHSILCENHQLILLLLPVNMKLALSGANLTTFFRTENKNTFN
jgi:hypothetical protein